MKYPNITVDTYDLIICVALTGGFATHNWIPFIGFTIPYLVKTAILTTSTVTTPYPK